MIKWPLKIHGEGPKMTILVSNIETCSTAEVKGHISDVIHLAGCERNCCYCFNKELRDKSAGEPMTRDQIIAELSDISDVVVITGGEPCLKERRTDLILLIINIKSIGKKVVLETAECWSDLWGICDKVLYCIKTWELNRFGLRMINIFPHAEAVAIFGHKDFNRDAFKKARKICGKLKIRFQDDLERHLGDLEDVEIFDGIEI